MRLIDSAPLMQKFFFGLAYLMFFSIGNATAQKPLHLPVDNTALVIVKQNGKVSYNVEIARTREQLEAGLMYRTKFPSDRAMLFIFPDQHIITMWMANTPLPLDMIFLDEKGIIVSVAKNTIPYSTKIVSSHVAAAFTIELNAGEAKKNGIATGQKVIHPAICGECKMDQR